MTNNKGSSLYFAIAVMAIILGIVLGTTSILIVQIRTVRGMGNSVVAIYAADTGVERVLKKIRIDGDIEAIGSSQSPEKIGNAEYWVEEPVDDSDDDCDALNYCIKSFGRYAGVQRAIEVKF